MAGFEVYSAESSESSDRLTVDYDALNKYVVETAGLQEDETLVGFISGIYDLGTQKLPNAEYKLDKEDEGLTVGELTLKHQDKIDKGEIIEFAVLYDIDTKTQMVKKVVPQKDRQAVCYSVDFPEIMLDKAPFFGKESDPKPLRMYIGGEWWDKATGKMVVGSMIPLKKTKDDKLGWTMHPLSALYKVAAASKVIPLKGEDLKKLKKGESPLAFQPEMIDKLLGKSLQFKTRIFFKQKDGKEYYNEKINFVGALARGQSEYEDVEASLVMFNSENDEVVLKELRGHVINTMARAKNFEGSVLEQQLIAIGRYTAPTVEEDFEESTTITAEDIMNAANNSPVDEEIIGF